MKKIGNALGNIYIIAVIIMVIWLVVSWVDIIADNDKPNPSHSKYNAFVLLTEEFPETVQEPAEAGCGNPLTYTDAIRFGTVYAKTEHSVIFEVEDGNLYEVLVGNPLHFHEEGFYCLFFDNNKITKVWTEVW